jgi:hypothetical protein
MHMRNPTEHAPLAIIGISIVKISDVVFSETFRLFSHLPGAISSNDGERGHGLRDPLHADSLDLDASAFDAKEDIY